MAINPLKSSFWTQQVTSKNSWVDKAFNATVSRGGKIGSATWSGAKWGAKWGSIGVGVAAAAVAIPVALSYVRNRNQVNEEDAPLPIDELSTAAAPRVLEAPPLPAMEYDNTPAQPARREVLGKYTADVLGRAGNVPNTISPDLIRNGRNTIDGSAGITDLGTVPAGMGGRG